MKRFIPSLLIALLIVALMQTCKSREERVAVSQKPCCPCERDEPLEGIPAPMKNEARRMPPK